MDISQLLSGDLGKQVIDGISKQAGTSEQETSSVVNAATPILLGMLKNNASSEEGASGILSALSEHSGLLDNLGGFLNSGNTAEGEGILGHILGGKKSTVENQLSKQTGVSSGSVSKILALLAPIVMSQLGKQAGSSNVSSGGGLNDLLGGMLGGGGNSGIGGNILGSILGGGKSSGGGIGDMLGGILGKK